MQLYLFCVAMQKLHFRGEGFGLTIMSVYRLVHYIITWEFRELILFVDATSIRIGKSMVGGGGDNRKVPKQDISLHEN